MSELWVPFHVALSMAAEGIGSRVLAWDELPRLLREGNVRAIAECTDIHEVTGARIRSYDVVLPKEWWNHPKIIRRLSDGKLYLSYDYEERYLDNGVWFYKAKSYNKVRIFKPDLKQYFSVGSETQAPDIKSSARDTGSESNGAAVRVGRPPKKIDTVIAAMSQIPRDTLKGMLEKEMAHTFRASRDTCRRARDRVLSKIVN